MSFMFWTLCKNKFNKKIKQDGYAAPYFWRYVFPND
ncbi:hypothetical protein SAMN05421881_10185 [Nitrosomonas halophila]|uniref:Uncharacterized protein n=1 Tax=Nitrosomonas halophila TaxID=44576 RepID=A0A1H3H2M5_9PROT|nr:hypothetical protein SAMN05421881_10185 [Nitrosomonas halophila]